MSVGIRASVSLESEVDTESSAGPRAQGPREG